ncbi:MAG: hypothetical protein WDA21_03735 [Bacilli bacterium]
MYPVREIETNIGSFSAIESLGLELADGSNKDILPIIASKPANSLDKMWSLRNNNLDQKTYSIRDGNKKLSKHEQIINTAFILFKRLSHGVYSRSKIIERNEELEKFSKLYDNLYLIANAYLASAIESTEDSKQKYNDFMVDLVEGIHTEDQEIERDEAEIFNGSLVNSKDLAGNAENCEDLNNDLKPLEKRQLVFIAELDRVCQKQNIDCHQAKVDRHY